MIDLTSPDVSPDVATASGSGAASAARSTFLRGLRKPNIINMAVKQVKEADGKGVKRTLDLTSETPASSPDSRARRE